VPLLPKVKLVKEKYSYDFFMKTMTIQCRKLAVNQQKLNPVILPILWHGKPAVNRINEDITTILPYKLLPLNRTWQKTYKKHKQTPCCHWFLMWLVYISNLRKTCSKPHKTDLLRTIGIRYSSIENMFTSNL